MAATWDWCERAAAMLVEELGREKAVEIVARFQELPSRNQSLNVTLERLERLLSGGMDSP